MEAVIARIKIPPEAIIPLAIGLTVLLTLVFFGTKLAAWKAQSPESAARFGLVTAGLFTAVSVFFLLRCLTNQSDPNNEIVGMTNITFTDAPIAGGMAAFAAGFWRMASQRLVALLIGGGIGVLMMAKPFVWPVLRQWDDSAPYPRGMMDPEHIMFLGPGLLAIIVAVIAAKKKPAR